MRMRMMGRAMVALASAAVMVLGVSGKAEAAPIPVELVLAIDASGSINAANYALQRDAYVNVLGSSLITTDGTIAIGVVEFGANVQTVFAMTLIDSAAAKNSLLAAIAGMNRNGISTGATAIGSAINASQAMLAAFDHANGNQVIDVSTDGQNNAGASLPGALAAANLGGTVVNCLGVGPGASCAFVNSVDNLALGGFSVLAPNFGAFQGALEQKIAQETGQVPEPTLMTLAGLGLVGLVVRRRVRR
jgi:hypothetical protein